MLHIRENHQREPLFGQHDAQQGQNVGVVEAFHNEALSEELVHFSRVGYSYRREAKNDAEASDENRLRLHPHHELCKERTVERFYSTVGLLVVAVNQESMINRPKVACVTERNAGIDSFCLPEVKRESNADVYLCQ